MPIPGQWTIAEDRHQHREAVEAATDALIAGGFDTTQATIACGEIVGQLIADAATSLADAEVGLAALMEGVRNVVYARLGVPEPRRNRLTDFEEALQEISEAKGAFKRDPHEHAKSCIADMQEAAINALKKHGISPRGKPVAER